MKKVKIPLMIQDRRTTHQEDLPRPTEGYIAVQEFFLDGPVTKRVAVLDIDPDTGQLHPPLKLQRTPGLKTHDYIYVDDQGRDLNDYWGDGLYQPEFLQVSVFATVLKTLEQFEKNRVYSGSEDSPEGKLLEKYGILGRELEWAFDAPQLFIVPRAGEMANAFYNRDTNSLEFFYFPSRDNAEKMIYSGLSREIIAHEAGHAIIDAIAPDLMDAYTPDSLAIHEGLADIVALFVSFASSNLTDFILNRSNGSIREESHFTNLAEEFAQGLREESHLRNFLNEKNLIPGSPNYVNSSEPHDACEVLTGAIYKVLVDLHESDKKRWVNSGRFQHHKKPIFSASGFALFTTYQRIKRVLFRALDYLPPGEVTFADYGRAIIAADRVESRFNFLRNWFAEEFVRRGIASTKNLLLKDKGRSKKVELDFDQLATSTYYAYKFAETHRELLLIPEDTSFEVHSCHLAQYYNGKRKGKYVCIFKVSWTFEEEGDLGDVRLPKARYIKMGTTLVIDIKTSKIIARLSNAYPLNSSETYQSAEREREYEEARLRRTNFLTHLFETGTLKLGQDALGPDGRVLQNAVQAETINGALRIRGTAKHLHLCK